MHMIEDVNTVTLGRTSEVKHQLFVPLFFGLLLHYLCDVRGGRFPSKLKRAYFERDLEKDGHGFLLGKERKKLFVSLN